MTVLLQANHKTQTSLLSIKTKFQNKATHSNLRIVNAGQHNTYSHSHKMYSNANITLYTKKDQQTLKDLKYTSNSS